MPQEVKELIKQFMQWMVEDIYKDFGIVPPKKDDKKFIALAVANNIISDESYNQTYQDKIKPYIESKYNLPLTIVY